MRAARANGSSRGRERLLAELAQRVVAALEQLACDRQTGAGAAKPLRRCPVVVVVRAGAPGRAERGLEQRPPQRRWTLTAQVPGRAAPVGLVDGDVQADIADRVARAREAARVTELGEDRDRRHLANPELAHQRTASRLAARIA